MEVVAECLDVRDGVLPPLDCEVAGKEDWDADQCE